MRTAIVTGSGGLIGSEAVRTLTREGYDVIGVDNDMRASFFGRPPRRTARPPSSGTRSRPSGTSTSTSATATASIA